MTKPQANRPVTTKIIATLGPASANRERLTEMFDMGLDICRLNFSHGDHASHLETLQLIRTLAEERGQPVCVFGDLCGPKIRLGKFAGGGVEFEPGDRVRFVRGDGPCTKEQFTISYTDFVDDVAPGNRIYIDDGLVRFLATDRKGDELLCTCTTGGRVSSRKGVNLPDSNLSTPALTEKDRVDLQWALENDLDYVALSFVRHPADLLELKELIRAADRDTPVIIKIEKPEALSHLDELIAETDAVLVARGDLGVETDIWKVPLVQKDLIRRCQHAGVPVIVATQMLQSMVENPIPTRAEVSDVANAIFDRADAVMLSGETAVGEHPGLAVDMMNRIAASTGEFLATQPPCDCAEDKETNPTDAAAHAAVEAARDLKACAVLVWTATGRTACRVARYRLPVPVVGLTYDQRVHRRMNLLYGVLPVLVGPLDHPSEMIAVIDRIVTDRGLASPGDVVVVVTSTRPTTPGATDTVLMHRVGEA